MSADSTSTYLSAAECTEIDHEISHAPTPAAVAIDALKIVQAHRGWVSDDSLTALAEYLGMSAAELDGIATFYSLIYRKPVGEQVISLCDSVTCWIKGYDRLQAHISGRLGVGLGETTADNKYTFLPAPCLGACDRAPVMMLGDDLHQDLDEKKLDQILQSGSFNKGGEV
ncbi:MAG: NADH-quinone oxidoreductase subunit NuoE [Gammaproteobacteria bacterium]|nr:NADH-quinone oxidoreductase subunit NuoE [Gammaproteobacteria bacterium]